jgi:hypothetical protein
LELINVAKHLTRWPSTRSGSFTMTVNVATLSGQPCAASKLSTRFCVKVFVPAEAVDTLLVPASGPWLKPGEAIEFVGAARPARAFPIHDAHLNDVGLETFDWWLDVKGGTDYARIPLGGSVDL